jgi:hypothetical protein
MSRTKEEREFVDQNANFARIASRHVAPEHIERVLTHVALNYERAMKDGRVPPDFDPSATEIDRHMRNVVQANPHVARVRVKPVPKRTW